MEKQVANFADYPDPVWVYTLFCCLDVDVFLFSIKILFFVLKYSCYSLRKEPDLRRKNMLRLLRLQKNLVFQP